MRTYPVITNHRKVQDADEAANTALVMLNNAAQHWNHGDLAAAGQMFGAADIYETRYWELFGKKPTAEDLLLPHELNPD